MSRDTKWVWPNLNAGAHVADVSRSILRACLEEFAYQTVILTDCHTRVELNSEDGGLSDTRMHCPKADYYVVKSLGKAVQWFLCVSAWNRTPRIGTWQVEVDKAGCRARTIARRPVLRVCLETTNVFGQI